MYFEPDSSAEQLQLLVFGKKVKIPLDADRKRNFQHLDIIREFMIILHNGESNLRKLRSSHI